MLLHLLSLLQAELRDKGICGLKDAAQLEEKAEQSEGPAHPAPLSTLKGSAPKAVTRKAFPRCAIPTWSPLYDLRESKHI